MQLIEEKQNSMKAIVHVFFPVNYCSFCEFMVWEKGVESSWSSLLGFPQGYA